MQDIAQLHRVRRLRWQARAPGAAEAFALRGLLREQAEAVQQAITRELDRLAPDGSFVHLPRLVIKLDPMALSTVDAQLHERVAAALRAALAELRLPPLPEQGAVLPSTLTAPADAAARPGHEVMADALRHYLATGLLPWHLAGMTREAVQEALERAAVRAVEGLLAGAQALDAWLPAAPLEARMGALLRWLPLLPAALRRRWLSRVESRAAGLDIEQTQRWRALIDSSDDDTASLEAQALWLAWPGRDDAPLSPPARAALSPRIVRPQRALERLHLSANLRDALRLPGDRVTESLPSRLPPLVTPQESLLVPLAGLVLLHPFLPRFLAGCGVLSENGRAIAEPQLPRACALLHGLACGAEALVIEHQLPLIKLLLGRAPDQPLDAALPRLDAADRDEVEAVLAAVREHWTALRGTGVDGLRTSFLQRGGLLRRADEAWQLHVQAEPFDLLLGMLPWGLSLIKLTWMAQPLRVEWAAP